MRFGAGSNESSRASLTYGFRDCRRALGELERAAVDYVHRLDEREEGGTPAIMGDLRAGVQALKDAIAANPGAVRAAVGR